MKENNTRRWLLCNVPRTRRDWIWTGIGVLLVAAVFFLFLYDLDARVCSADVNRENGQIAFFVPEEQKLYVFREDGTPAWEYAFSPEQTGGGVANVFYEGGQVAVHPAREETVLLFNEAGELVKTRPRASPMRLTILPDGRKAEGRIPLRRTAGPILIFTAIG